MTVKINMKNDLMEAEFFNKLKLNVQYGLLKSLGFCFVFDYASFSVNHPDTESFVLELPCPVMSLMMGSSDQLGWELARTKVKKYVNDLETLALSEHFSSKLKKFGDEGTSSKSELKSPCDFSKNYSVKQHIFEIDTLKDLLKSDQPLSTGKVKPSPSWDGLIFPPQPVGQNAESVKTPTVSKKPRLLSKASKLMEPVRGTDQNSVYYVIGLGKRFNFAARLKGNILSVRAEGSFLQGDVSLLDTFGFTSKEDGRYWSCHYETKKGTDCERIIGALLFSGGFELTKKLTNYEEFSHV